MDEVRDPAIKLFGKTIPLPENGSGSDATPISDPNHENKDTSIEIANNEVSDTISDAMVEMEQGKKNSSSCLNNVSEDEHQTSTVNDVQEAADAKPEEDQNVVDVSGQEKVLKKPDKILPCPRCNSMDTKFCYYNNYNVNQPRHFCKNCQRYWTAGGTMRNVPVGAGRRKNKHTSSHYHHLMMPSDGLASAHVDDSTCPQALPCGSSAPVGPLKGSGTILKFGPEAPLCESMASVLNLGDQKKNAEIGKEEPLCASSVPASNFVEDGVQKEQNAMPGYCNGLTPMHPPQCYPGPLWAYPWNPPWNNHIATTTAAAAISGARCSSDLVNGQEKVNINAIQWSSPPIMATPAFCAPPIPIPFMPPAFWTSMPGWANGTWSVPLVGSNGCLSPTSSTSNSGCSGNGSPTLGKHNRDASLLSEEKMERSLWIPKTLRIDDPDEAAKSSIWATLGIKPHEGGMFKAFQSKSKGMVQKSDAEQVLHANPAALSRSQSFQEA